MTASTSDSPDFTPAAPGGMEVRSIDHVPEAERHGKVWPLAAVWVAGNANLGTVAVGAVGIFAGGGLFWTLVAVVLGSAFGTIFAALHSTQGPHLGLPQLIQSRPQFGYLGALVVLVLALVTYLGFNVFVNILGGVSLNVTTGVPAGASYVLISLAAALIALVGYDWIHGAARILTAAFTVVFIVLTGVILADGGLSAGDFAPGPFNTTAFLLQFGAVAGYQINWSIYVSDYTRYLPSRVSGRAMFACTYLGMTLSAAWLAGLGALLATSFPDLDSITGAQAAGNQLFGHFGDVAVLVGLGGLVIVGAMNTYGGALTLISMLDCVTSVRFGRAIRATAIGIVTAVALVISLAAPSDFLASYAGFLIILLYLFAPWTAINLTDYFLIRRGHYDIGEIFNRTGIYGRWNARGLLAYAAGILAQIPFANTTWFQGPIAEALGGADIAPFIGLLVGFLVYWTSYQGHDLSHEPDGTRAAETPHAAAPTSPGLT